MKTILNAALLIAVVSGLAGCLEAQQDLENIISDITDSEEVSPDSPFQVNEGWMHFSQSEASGVLSATFEVRPGSLNMDGVISLSESDIDDSSAAIASVRFSPSGLMEARDADEYRADVDFTYIEDQWYEIKIDVDFTTRTYDVSVALKGNSLTLLVQGADFRSGSEAISSVSYASLWTSGIIGSLELGSLVWDAEQVDVVDSETIEPDYRADNEWVHSNQNLIQGDMTTTFLMRAESAQMDGFVALSSAAADDFDGLLATVRFAPSGQIDVRDGSDYRSDVAFYYSPGVWYEVTIQTNVVSRLYSVSVGEYADETDAVDLIVNAAYRTGTDETAGITNLTLWSADTGAIEVAQLSWPESDVVATDPTDPTDPVDPEDPDVETPEVYGDKCEIVEIDGNTHLRHYEYEWVVQGVNHNAGAYITGDCWITGPVVIESVTPEPYSNSNGSIANPAAGPDTYQGYESGLALYDASLRLSFPYSAEVNTSIVSSLTDPTFEGTNNRQGWIVSHGILTVISTIASEGHFRPPYSDPDKEAYEFTFSDLSLSHIPRVDSVGETTPSADTIIEQTIRPWVDHHFEYLGRGLHAINNMPGYGGNLTSTIGTACLASALDWPDEYRLALIANMVQIGIDNYGMIEVGQYFPANGGHHSGRLLPILYAGKALNHSGMLNVTSRTYPIEHGFAENCQTYGDGLYGIRYCSRGDESSNYSSVNSPTWVAESLCARMIGVEENWDHQPFFDYVDNWTQSSNFGDVYDPYNYFHNEMWLQYNSDY
ncbi:hypothetical protein [Reinekea marinisedimentorum]|uniref:Uncharacterized protein n=1 Tax=Reinekea marinisedimentorum TaxID=230495 RepID=A0A4R3I715_9GAMM|nr:hypothetical protein [Reinekea marinisedimentorum]TCS41786.1 hypothetical protein BCF53_105214 [Reinekea marinisedimentorum]